MQPTDLVGQVVIARLKKAIALFRVLVDGCDAYLVTLRNETELLDLVTAPEGKPFRTACERAAGIRASDATWSIVSLLAFRRRDLAGVSS